MTSAHFVTCGDWTLRYTRQGSGPSLILLHGGLPGTTGTGAFRDNLGAWSQHFTTYVIDFPGWGGSSKNLIPLGQWSDPLAMAGQVIGAFMNELGIARAHLLGGSFGAAAAIHAALNHPGKIDRLVLMAPGGGVPVPQRAIWPALVKLLTYYDEEGPTRAKFESLARHMVFDTSLLTPEWMSELFEASRDPAVIANPPLRLPPKLRRAMRILRHVVASPVLSRLLPRRFPGAAQALCNDPRLATLQAPVLFIWGRDDQMQPIECLKSFREIPQQDALLLGRCGHWPHREHPHKVNDAVTRFLQGG